MSKKTATKTAKTEVVVTKVKDLEAKHGLDGKTIRVIIRGLGYRAPKTDLKPGEIGPTALYVWSSDNEKQVKALASIEAAIKAYKENDAE